MTRRKRREREAPEVGAMAVRVVRALVRRADEGDTEALEQLLGLEVVIGRAIHEAGAGLHRFGYSYTELAGVAGITKQAARVRFNSGEVVHATPPDGLGVMPCCGRTPFEVPRTDRMTEFGPQVTCTGTVSADV